MKVKELVNAMPRGCHFVAVDRNEAVLAEAMEREVLKILTVDADFMMLLVGDPESEGAKA